MDTKLLHNILIYGHAVGGLAAFGIGCLILRPRQKGASLAFNSYLFALFMMVLLLVIVVLVDWNNLRNITRLVYSGLTLLALYTGMRGWQARQQLRNQKHGWRTAYIDHVGFTLISLFDGFVIVSALDLNAPGWVVGVIGVLGVVVGIGAINRFKKRAISDA